MEGRENDAKIIVEQILHRAREGKAEAFFKKLKAA
jgi:hypothetical protein